MTKARLHSEQIYQAMVDDEAFANLPTILAQSVGARSCVIHWRDAQQDAEIMAHSPYFSAAQMLDYAENFVEHDQWSNCGKERPFVNRIWNTKDMVSPTDYEGSIFYNEWIRAMGDDTFHCMGTVMETERGLGLIGLHRGKCQADFDAEAIKGLNRNIIHLRRMLTVRARLVKDSARIRDLVALLDCNPAPMFAVTARGRIVHANAAADALIEGATLLHYAAGQLHAVDAAADRRLYQAIARASDPASPEAGLVTVPAPGGERLELSLSPVSDRGTGLVLVSGRDLDAETGMTLVPTDARDVLSPRELAVARFVAMGLRNRDIAERMGLTEGTVKVYLHHLFAKVGVKTRTELALLVGRRSR